MAAAKKKTTKAKKPAERLKKLITDDQIVSDFMAGMASDKEAGLVRTAVRDTKPFGYISTGAASLDKAIGRPGIPLSRISILHGKEGSGKTTVALQLIAEVQRRGGMAVYIDKERKLDKSYAQKLGVDLARLLEPAEIRTLEDVIAVINGTIRRAKEIRKKTSKTVPILIIVDSLNACKAFETVETATGKKRYPAEARIWSEELPGIVDGLDEEPVGLVFVSQVRKKMNVTFGNDEELAGGNAPRFYASLIIYISRVGTEKGSGSEKAEKIGSVVEAECRKNQISPPFQKGRFVIYWARGVDYEHSLLRVMIDLGVVKKKAQGYLELKRGKGRKPFPLGQGMANAAGLLRENVKLRDKLKGVFYKRMGWS